MYKIIVPNRDSINDVVESIADTNKPHSADSMGELPPIVPANQLEFTIKTLADNVAKKYEKGVFSYMNINFSDFVICGEEIKFEADENKNKRTGIHIYSVQRPQKDILADGKKTSFVRYSDKLPSSREKIDGIPYVIAEDQVKRFSRGTYSNNDIIGYILSLASGAIIRYVHNPEKKDKILKEVEDLMKDKKYPVYLEHKIKMYDSSLSLRPRDVIFIKLNYAKNGTASKENYSFSVSALSQYGEKVYDLKARLGIIPEDTLFALIKRRQRRIGSSLKKKDS